MTNSKGFTDPRTLLIDQLQSGESIMTKAVNDLNDREFHTRLPGRGESVNWIFGHLATNEDWFLMKLTGSAQQVSGELQEKYQADESPPADSSTPIVERHDILNFFRFHRARVIEALQKTDITRWDDPAPDGLPLMFSTLGSAWGILGTHQYWHLGQIMTIRQMLAKEDFMV